MTRQKLYYWLPTLAWMGVIFWFSAQPALKASAMDWQDFLIRKSAHFVEYFVLTWLLFYSLRHTSRLSLQKCLLLSFLISLLYAVSDEYHQTQVTGREGKVRDVLIDGLGILTSAWALVSLSSRL